MVEVLKKLRCVFDFSALPKVVLRHRFLLWQLVWRNIGQKYKGSLLGLCWSCVQPLMMLAVYTFVFSQVFRPKWGEGVGGVKGEFAVIIFCGMALYSVFSESVNSCCSVVSGNPNFVKKVVFPLEILPLAQTLSSFFLGAVWFVMLFFGIVYVLGTVHWTMLLLPLLLIPLFLFSLGIAYLVASLGVFVRDTQYAVGVIFQILYFMTPIFYPISAVPERYRIYLEANPLAMLIEAARDVFLYGRLPDWQSVGIAALLSVIVAQLGFSWFVRTKRGFADVL